MPADQGFDAVLIANRGEIACRVIRSARALGLRTVAVYSEADEGALHARMADSAVRIGESAPSESYLNVERILAACQASGAGAVHPGYGFLAESANFARACRDARLVFVGPSPEAIEALGNKAFAKRLARRVGVPCLPGYDGDDQSIETLLAQARALGGKLMIKAAAGGGGRGMRRCDDPSDETALRALIEAARREALGAFGDASLLLESLLADARHVEVQVFGDACGNFVHLGERECSTQRRHQKIIEEAPATGLAPEVRDAMCAGAIALAREAGYRGAGTVEFLLQPDGRFHFLEMNTRLQVEHPATEAVTGIDLVEWQLRVARGEALALAQSQIRFDGHAIEARLCAEDPEQGFAPQSGVIRSLRLPDSGQVRVDHGLGDPAFVSPHYDSMIAKLIAHGRDREQARARLLGALAQTRVVGLPTNRSYLIDCLRAPAFVDAAISTNWLEAWSATRQAAPPDSRWFAIAAACRVFAGGERHGALAGWSSTGSLQSTILLRTGAHSHSVRVESSARLACTVSGEGWRHEIAAHIADRWRERACVDGIATQIALVGDLAGGWLDALGHSARFDDCTLAPSSARRSAVDGRMLATMHGRIAAVAVGHGESVAFGQRLLSIEAMKMEHHVCAPTEGVVAQIAVRDGDQVSPGRLLVVIERDAQTEQGVQ
ncbi:MAG: 3-methylcrotonyl-CoA carboxylase [Burkholderiaceae bacterium]|nr:3-methylcrotonyl-CoA carboxylase [Burkholderiaceae bacterium]